MNWNVFTQLSSLEIQIHWVTAVLAFILGIVIFSQKKGTSFHKTVGWIYVILMMITAGAAFFVRNISDGEAFTLLGGMSWIHLFIPLTVFGIGGALVAIRRGNVSSHKRAMIGTFLGALIIAGLFTLLPGRRMHLLMFGDPEKIQEIIDRRSPKE